ncbi:MAG: tetratricopeptide repeat protein [Mangrovibacterium sp.]
MKFILSLILLISSVVSARSQNITEQLRRSEQLQELDPDSSILISQQAITSIPNGQKGEKAYAYWNIAQANLYKHKYHAALFYAVKAKEMFGDKDTSLIYQDILATIGWVYFDIGNYQHALPYHQKALETAQLRKDLYGEVLYINALGLNALNSLYYTKALSYFQKGILLLKNNLPLEKSLLSTIQCNIGVIYSKYEDWNKAQSYLLKSIDNAPHTATSLVETYAALSNVYLQTRKFDKCKKYLDIADSLSYYTHYSFSLIEYYKVRSEFEQIRGNFREAYRYQDKYVKLLNKINNTDKQEVMNYLLDIQKEKITQDKLIIKQAKKINTNRSLLIIIIIAIALSCVAVLYYIFHSKSKKVLLRQQKLTQELEEKEKQETLLNNKLQYKDEVIETLAFTISKRNELVKELGNNIGKHSSNDLKIAWNTFEQTLNKHQNSTILSDELLKDFRFKLQKNYLELTDKDIQLLIDIRSNFSSKELADKYHVEVKSIEMSRYRLRKKLHLEKGDSLREFIARI